MHVRDYIKHSAVFVGQFGQRGEFIPHGTAFIIAMTAHGYTFLYLVTAKHVIDQASPAPDNRDVILRINKSKALGGGLIYLKFPKKKWQYHPDHVDSSVGRQYIDVAVCYIEYDFELYEWTAITEKDLCNDDIVRKFVIDTGDEIVIAGLLFAAPGIQKNIPIIRIGNIAAMPDEPVPTDYGSMDAYLIEVRSVGGISGSPVFTHLDARTKSVPGSAIGEKRQTHYLLGLMHGHYTINTQEEFAIKTRQSIGDMNAGIAIVVPTKKILETISQPELLASQTARAHLMHGISGSSRLLKKGLAARMAM